MTAAVILQLVALLAYLAAAVIYGANLSLKHQGHARLGRVLLAVGVAVHTVAIGAICVGTHLSPVASAFGSLSTTAWAIALVSLIVEATGYVTVMGALATPLACMLIFAAFLRGEPRLRMSPQLQTSVINLHVLLSLLSIAIFAVAGCCAAFYLWQYGVLRDRKHRPGFFRLLPPLEKLDRCSFRLVAFGLPLLTLGLVLGIERATHGGLPHTWPDDPHTIASFILWVLYASYLVGRTTSGLRGTRASYLLLVGLITSLALFALPTTTHRFH